MGAMQRFLAFDLGAESGRAILGILNGANLALRELHRFPNTPVRLPQGLFWDMLRLFHEIEEGIRVGSREFPHIDGIGVDTWGVDFGLLGADGTLVENPRCYRDARTNGILEAAFQVMPREALYRRTGIQFLQFNSLFQLFAMQRQNASALPVAAQLLHVPDLLNYWLTGKAVSERTIVSTSQFYNPAQHIWDKELLQVFGVDPVILGDIVDPGALLGPLLPDIAEMARASSPIPVYASAGHDTACAVAAAPALPRHNWCYISSGTWSLMGAELDAPIMDERALAHTFTNEVGVGGKIRFLKNIMGLWLLQECRRAWAADGKEFTYDELVIAALSAPPFQAVVDPDAFLAPGRMPEKIQDYCSRTGQPVPSGPEHITRVIFESLAVCYRKVLADLEDTLGRRMDVIHILGGGSRNSVLNQFVADATGRTVIAGPAEATAIGNVLVQAMGSGLIESHEKAREVVRNSFEVKRFEPQPNTGWETAYATFRQLTS
jgi:rhamnulokinase